MKYIIMLIVCSACTSPQMTFTTLQKAGFTEIESTGYALFACSEDDTFKTKFTAVNQNGEHIDGAVCCGLFKNCTIRF